MLIRVELFGHTLHLELNKNAEPEPEQRPPDTAPTPMTVYAEEPADPLGFRSILHNPPED